MNKVPDNSPKLTRGPVGPLLVRMTAPMLLGLMSIVAFNLADTFFVGRLGTDQLAALTFTFPVVVFISSIALSLGAGASAVISRLIGSGDSEGVKRIATDSLILSVSIVALFIILGLLTIDPLFRLLGAKGNTLPYIREYMEVWYLGMLFVVVPMVGNSIIRATGDMLLPGLTMCAAALINCILDPLFIFGIGPFPEMGIRGAAFATVIGRMITFVLALYILIKREKILSFRIPGLSMVTDSWRKILHIGIPIAVTRTIMPVASGVLTRFVSAYGEEAVAAFGVSTRIEFLAGTILVSLAIVFGPFVGQNWMSGEKERVRAGVRISAYFCMIWGFGAYLLLLLLAPFIVPLFSKEAEVAAHAVTYLRIAPAAMGFFGLLQLSASALNVLKRPLTSLALTIFHMLVLLVPLSWAGSHFFKLKGIYFAIPLSLLIAGSFSFTVLKRIISNQSSINIAKDIST